MDWDKGRHDYIVPPLAEPPAPTLIELCWRLLMGPSGRILSCGIYRTMADYIEVRCGYSDLHLVRSQLVGDIEAGRTLADEWREAIRAMGSCEDLELGQRR
jgi:hypothetical protein